jgi:hypothetical protein
LDDGLKFSQMWLYLNHSVALHVINNLLYL